MNINKHYFKTYPESNGLYDIEKDSIKSHYIVINTLERSYEHESLWSLRIKFGVDGNKLVKLPIYKNDSEVGLNGHTINGFSYYPWSPVDSSWWRGRKEDDIVGFRSALYLGESGCIISRRMRNISNIEYIRLEVPRSLTDGIPNFNHILNISCDELSGFSNTCITNNDDISFVTTLTETSPTSLVYTSYAKMKFNSPLNLQSLTLKVTNSQCELSNLDSIEISHIRINQNGRLEIITSNIPNSFKESQILLLPNMVLTSETDTSNMIYEHQGAVIDGYIKDATVIVRELDGKLVYKSKSDKDGIFIPKFRNGTKVLIFSSIGGIDISYNKENKIEFRTLYSPSSVNKSMNITPLTTLVADYIIYLERKNKEINEKIIENVYNKFNEALSVENINSDYIATNNIVAAKVGYSIVTIVKVLNVILGEFTNYKVNSSYITTKLSLRLMERGLNMCVALELEDFMDELVYEQKEKRNMEEYERIKEHLAISLANHNNFENEEMSFELLGKASLIVHNDLEKRDGLIEFFYKRETYEEIVSRRSHIDPTSGDISIDLPRMNVNLEELEGISEILQYSIERVKTIINSIIVGYLPMVEEKATSLIKIEEVIMPKVYNISRSYWGDRRIEINSSFPDNRVEGRFSLNGNPCNLYTIILLREILYILGYNNELECKFKNEIMNVNLSQNLMLSYSTLENLESVGYVVNFNSIFVGSTCDFSDEDDNVGIKFFNERLLNESRGEDRQIINPSDSVLNYGKSLPKKHIELVNNIPISDKRNKCKLKEVIFNCARGGILISIIIESNVSGIVHLKPVLSIDNLYIESKDMIRKKVQSGTENRLHLEFMNHGERLEDKTHKVKLDLEFYFGSFISSKVKVSNMYLVKNTIEWTSLPILEFSNIANSLEKLEEIEALDSETKVFSEYEQPILLEELTEAVDDSGIISASNSYIKEHLSNTLKVVFHTSIYVLKSNGFIVMDDFGNINVSITDLVNVSDLLVSNSNVFVICDDSIKVYSLGGNLKGSLSGINNMSGLKCGTFSESSNILIVLSERDIYTIAINIATNGDVSMGIISLMNSESIDKCYKLCCNKVSVLQKVYLISRQNDYLMQLDFEDPSLPVIEGSFSSECMKEPRSILYIESRDLIIVGCYLSKSVLIFEANMEYSVPKLIRVIGVKENPSDISYLEDESKLDIYISTNRRISEPINRVTLYDSDGVLQVYNQPSVYTLDESIGYNNVFVKDDTTLLCVSYRNEVIDVYDISDFDASITFPIVSEIETNEKEYRIHSINRDIEDYNIIELDDIYDEKNVNLEINGDNKLAINKDLQITYTINMTSQILLDNKI